MRTFNTRKPTGQVSWPLIILAGIEGAGKTWAAVEATGLPLIDRSFFLQVGEQMADEYAAVPGADFEIIEHNSSVFDLLDAAAWAAEQPAADGKANLLIVDSLTEVWGVITDKAQRTANQRRARRGGNQQQEAQITMDLWNTAKAEMQRFMDALKRFPGPVILTCRLQNVSVVDGATPTGEKVWKLQAEKNAPYEVQAVVQARRPREWTLTKIASTRVQLQPGGEMPWPDFSVGALLDAMGINATTQNAAWQRPSAAADILPDDLQGTLRVLVENLRIDELRRLYQVACSAGDAVAADLIGQAGAQVSAAIRQRAEAEQQPAPAEDAAAAGQEAV